MAAGLVGLDYGVSDDDGDDNNDGGCLGIGVPRSAGLWSAMPEATVDDVDDDDPSTGVAWCPRLVATLSSLPR